MPPGIQLATCLRMSPLAIVLQERFEEICRAELVRLRRKTASLSATHRAELDVISLSVARAIAARLSDAIDRDQRAETESVVSHLFAVPPPE